MCKYDFTINELSLRDKIYKDLEATYGSVANLPGVWVLSVDGEVAVFGWLSLLEEYLMRRTGHFLSNYGVDKRVKIVWAVVNAPFYKEYDPNEDPMNKMACELQKKVADSVSKFVTAEYGIVPEMKDGSLFATVKMRGVDVKLTLKTAASIKRVSTVDGEAIEVLVTAAPSITVGNMSLQGNDVTVFKSNVKDKTGTDLIKAEISTLMDQIAKE